MLRLAVIVVVVEAMVVVVLFSAAVSVIVVVVAMVVVVLLAPQSGALRRSAYRDFHPIPLITTSQKRCCAVAVYGKVDQ